MKQQKHLSSKFEIFCTDSLLSRFPLSCSVNRGSFHRTTLAFGDHFVDGGLGLLHSFHPCWDTTVDHGLKHHLSNFHDGQTVANRSFGMEPQFRPAFQSDQKGEIWRDRGKSEETGLPYLLRQTGDFTH